MRPKIHRSLAPVWALVALLSPGLAFGGALSHPDGPVSVNRTVARDLLREAATRRIDIIGLGDSNQLFQGYGWQDGVTFAMGERYPMFATPTLGAGNNFSIGIALGSLVKSTFAPTGAPPELLEFNDPDSGIDAVSYGYLASGETIPANTDIGLWLIPGSADWPKNNFNVDHKLRAHYKYGISDAPAGARFRPQFFQPAGFDVTAPPLDPTLNVYTVFSSFLEVPAGSRNTNNIRFRWFGEDEVGGVGPVHAISTRVEDADEQAGFSVHTLYGVGGATARDCAIAIQSASDEHLIQFFADIRQLQGAAPKILIRISFGANDFTSTAPSVGPDGPFETRSPQGVRDNLRAIIDRIEEIWTIAGWDLNEIEFLLIGAHIRIQESEPGFALRAAISELAEADGHAFINHGRFFLWTELLTMGMYTFPTGAHLNEFGYDVMCRTELDTIMQTLPADFNGDCAVTSSDLAILISSFGGPAADLNGDGVTDSSDLAILIMQFGDVCEG